MTIHYFEYRFLYKLRNYVVHCESPPTTVQSTIENPNNEIYFNRDLLLENFDKWGKVKDDLLSVSDNLNIKKILLNAKSMFQKFHKEVVLLDEFNILHSLNFLKGFALIVDNEMQFPVVLVTNDEDGAAIEIKRLFYDNIQRADRMIYDLGIRKMLVYRKEQGTVLYSPGFSNGTMRRILNN